MNTHNLDKVRQSFEDFMFARNEQLKIEGHDENSKFWVTNSHYQTWLTAQDIYSYQDNILAEQNQQLAAQNAELVAQVEAYRATLEYFLSQEFEWNDPHDSMIDDIHRLLEIPSGQLLRDIKATAARDGFVAAIVWIDDVNSEHKTSIGAAEAYASIVKGGL